MISKAQSKYLVKPVLFQGRPRLTAIEKGMLKWITADPSDKVLDAGIGSGLAAEYLVRNMQCEVCGLSSNMETVRRARARLRDCDIIYAGSGEIPWHDASFDIVLFSGEEGDSSRCRTLLEETRRVLKNGGQLVLGLRSIFGISSYSASSEEDEGLPRRRSSLIRFLQNSGFRECSWIRTGLTTAVVVAWKMEAQSISSASL